MSRTDRTLTSHHWGAGVAVVDDGRLKRVEPYYNDPNPSALHDNLVEGIYGGARITRPAVRTGFLKHGPGRSRSSRGDELFEEVDWDVALELVAEELKRVRDTHGNASIFGGSYGWASAGRFHHAQSQLKRFLNAFGGFVRSEGNYSFNAALVLMPYIVGDFRQSLKHATRWNTVASDGSLVVMFGGLPQRNLQISGGGIIRHQMRQHLEACAKNGVRFINLSPMKSDADATLDAEWLPVKPGTDTAIMLGLSHTLIEERLYDSQFIHQYTTGFQQIEAYLSGKTDGTVKNAEWAARISGLTADRIRSLARDMASNRTLITTAASLQRVRHGEQPLWATITLAALLGQIGLPGGGYGIAYGADGAIGTVDRPFRWPNLPQGNNRISDFIPVACLADMLLHPGTRYQYNGETRRYPHIRLVWWAGGNPFHHHQDLGKLQRAFKQPDTVIVNEINWTSTARHADIVLPVCSSLEREDFGAGTQDNTIIPMPRTIDPVGEAREEYAIYCELEERLDLGQQFSHGKTSSDWLEYLWKQLVSTAATQGHDLPDFEDFMKGDAISFEDPDPDRVFLSEFRNNPDLNPLSTPSGKIELYSQTIADFGYPDCPGHAIWIQQNPLDQRRDDPYPLNLLSTQPEVRLHSQFDNGSLSRSKKIGEREPITIHPTDAAHRGIRDGDIVLVYNQQGSCLAGAQLSDQIKEGVVNLNTGAWYDPDRSTAELRDNHGNPNVLTSDLRTSSLSQGPAVQATVQIRKFEGPLPEMQVFKPPLIKA